LEADHGKNNHYIHSLCGDIVIAALPVQGFLRPGRDMLLQGLQ
jgi:hypothetical protein